MTRKDFFKTYVQPYMRKSDKPFNRQLWHDTKDSLHKDGLITDKQVNNWIYPRNKYFE